MQDCCVKEEVTCRLRSAVFSPSGSLGPHPPWLCLGCLSVCLWVFGQRLQSSAPSPAPCAVTLLRGRVRGVLTRGDQLAFLGDGSTLWCWGPHPPWPREPHGSCSPQPAKTVLDPADSRPAAVCGQGASKPHPCNSLSLPSSLKAHVLYHSRNAAISSNLL